jgi:hypothetical protein
MRVITLVVNYTELCYGGYFCKHTESECAGRAEARYVFQETSNVYPRQTDTTSDSYLWQFTFLYTGTLFCMRTLITLHADRFACREAELAVVNSLS